MPLLSGKRFAVFQRSRKNKTSPRQWVAIGIPYKVIPSFLIRLKRVLL